MKNLNEERSVWYCETPKYFPTIGMRTFLKDSEVKAVLQYLGLDFRSSRVYRYIAETIGPKFRGGISRLERSEEFRSIEIDYNSEVLRCLVFDWKDEEWTDEYYFDVLSHNRQGPYTISEITAKIEGYSEGEDAWELECLLRDCSDDYLYPGEPLDITEVFRIYDEEMENITMMNMQELDAARSE